MKPSPWYKSKRFWLGISISAFFVYKLAHDVPMDEVLDALREANYLYCLPALAFYFLAVWFRAVRWHFILKPVKNVPSRVLFPYVVIGYAGNNVLPLRAGELLRSYICSVREDIRISTIFATIAVERIFDGLVMLVFVVFTSLMLPAFNQSVEKVIELAGLLFAVLFIFVFLLVVFKEHALKTLAWLFKPLPKKLGAALLNFSDFFINGLKVIRSKRDTFIILLNSVLFWLLEAMMYYFILLAFRHVFPADFDQPLLLAVFTVAITNLVIIMPSGPSFIGTFHFGCALALGIYSFGKAAALSYANLLWFCLFIPIAVLGLGYMYAMKISMRDVSNVRNKKRRLRG